MSVAAELGSVWLEAPEKLTMTKCKIYKDNAVTTSMSEKERALLY